MLSETKMTCPACGAQMNLHAEKLVYASRNEPGYNRALDGAIDESHFCPSCGTAASRRRVT